MQLCHYILRRYTGNRGGFTLIELMVACFVSVIIVSAVYTLFIETQSHNSIEKARATLIKEARQLISVTGDGFYSSTAAVGFIPGLRGIGGCSSNSCTPSPLPPTATGSPVSSLLNAHVQNASRGIIPDYIILRDYILLLGSNPDYVSNVAAMTGNGYITDAAIYCDDYAVINGYDGTYTTAYARFNLSDPDSHTRLGTDIVHEEIWALYTLNVGRRL